ncbi:MAG TPA: hypothetical protein PLR99_24115, partial [Polyangiaceae bacterium]|nr:hypothetical protein [Polyangiaceae bacterium]
MAAAVALLGAGCERGCLARALTERTERTSSSGGVDLGGPAGRIAAVTLVMAACARKAGTGHVY